MIPSQIRSKLPHRICRSTVAGLRLSRCTLMRLSPARLSGVASLGSSSALVVSARSPTSGHRREPLDDLEQVGAERRLAAGQAELAKADADRGAHHQLDLGRRQQFFAGQEAQALERHAVDASQVAVVDNRNAEVIDFAVEGIFWHVCLDKADRFDIPPVLRSWRHRAALRSNPSFDCSRPRRAHSTSLFPRSSPIAGGRLLAKSAALCETVILWTRKRRLKSCTA